MEEKRVKITEILDETPESKSFKLEKPDGFEYKAGQYVMFVIGEDDHMFTLSSSPTEDFLMVSVKMGTSEFKKKMIESEDVTIKGPMGRFILEEGKKHVMIAGGIGITPFRSMIKYAADSGIRDEITLLYSNKIPEDIAFRKEFDEIAKENSNLKLVYTVTRPEESKEEWRGDTGRISEEMISKLDKDSVFYVCGPPAMVDAMTALLGKMDIKDIRIEKFTGY